MKKPAEGDDLIDVNKQGLDPQARLMMESVYEATEDGKSRAAAACI